MGVSVEAVASRWMARDSVRRLLQAPAGESHVRGALSYSRIWQFYYPLALTSLIGLAVPPLLTFFMGRAPAPVESLAVFPVVGALSFIFRAMGLSYQEVVIALMGRRYEHVRELGRFALVLGLASSAGLALVAFTPVAGFWFETVSGLSPDLARYAIVPTMVLAPIPALSVLLSFQRGILVVAHVTRPIVWSTVLEVAGIAVAFLMLGWRMGMVGVTAATVAFLVGRLAGTLYLVGPCVRAVKRGA